MDQKVSKRTGKIFFDANMNARVKTLVAPYSARVIVGAPVAMPVTWEELGRARTADKFNLRNALERLEETAWDDAEAKAQRLPV